MKKMRKTIKRKFMKPFSTNANPQNTNEVIANLPPIEAPIAEHMASDKSVSIRAVLTSGDDEIYVTLRVDGEKLSVIVSSPGGIIESLARVSPTQALRVFVDRLNAHQKRYKLSSVEVVQ